MIREIKIPRLGANDDIVFGEWQVESEKKVKKGDVILVIETSKEAAELTSEYDGYLYIIEHNSSEYKVDSVIAYVCDNIEEFCSIKDVKPDKENVFDGSRMTKKAFLLAQKYDIDISNLESDKIIKEKDIEVLIKKNGMITQPDFSKHTCNDLLILCGGGLCKMSIEAIRSRGGFNIHGIIDSQLKKGSMVSGIEVLGSDNFLEQLFKSGYKSIVNSLGSITSDNTGSLFFRRKELFEQVKSLGYNLPNIIHPTASVASSVRFGEGNLVFAGSVIDSNVFIGDNIIINTGSIISHDCQIGDHCRISPGAILAGNVIIGENSLIGMGVTVYMGAKIGKNVIVTNGKNIFTNISDNTIIK
jgi:sugar O-acyltransferase (sialic acid O-acetyltransferase NeuD family)